MKDWEKELYIYRLDPAPPRKKDLQEYIALYCAEKDDKHLAWFLHYFEKVINTKVMGYVQRFAMYGHFLDLKQGATTAANIAKALNLRTADIEAFVSAHPDRYHLDRAAGTVVMIGDGDDSGEDPSTPAYAPSADASGTQSAGDTSDYEHYEQSENPYFDAYGYFTMDLANPRPATVAGMARALKVSEAEVKAFIARHPSEWSIDADGQKVRYENRTHFDPAAEAALTGRSSASSGTADGTV